MSANHRRQFSMLNFGRPSLPDEALRQLRCLLDDFFRLVGSVTTANPVAIRQMTDLKTKIEQDRASLWWPDIAQVELCIVEVLQDDEMRQRIGDWRRRMGQVFSAAVFAKYIADAPAIATAKPAVLRADLADCIRTVYYCYGAYAIAARSRARVGKTLFINGLAVIVVLALSTWIANHFVPSRLDLLLCIFGTAAMGVIGSVVSVQRRLQDPSIDGDPMYRYVQTTADRFGVAIVSPIFGAVFGLVIYALLVSKLLFNNLIGIANGVPSSPNDVALMLVFGFLAGFAEQLVPDALTRIAATALSTVGASAARTAPTAPIPPANGAGPAPSANQTADPTASGAGGRNGSANGVSNPVIARLARPPADATPEAKAQGQDPSLASESRPESLQQGVVTDANR